MGWILWIILAQALVCGGCCAFVASEKNREVVAHFFGGFFLGIFWLIAIAGVPAISNEVKEAREQPSRRAEPVVGGTATVAKVQPPVDQGTTASDEQPAIDTNQIPVALFAVIAIVMICFFMAVITST